MAVTHVATSTVQKDSAGNSAYSFSHTFDASTTLALFHGVAPGNGYGASGTPTIGVSNCTSISEILSAASDDVSSTIWGMVSPGSGAKTCAMNLGSPQDAAASCVVVVEYAGTVTTSVADAVKVLDTANNNATPTGTATFDPTAGVGASSGNGWVICSGAIGDDMDVATADESFSNSRVNTDSGGGQSNNQDCSIIIVDNLTGTVPGNPITLTYNATDENVGQLLQLVAASTAGGMMMKMMQEGHLNG